MNRGFHIIRQLIFIPTSRTQMWSVGGRLADERSHPQKGGGEWVYLFFKEKETERQEKHEQEQERTYMIKFGPKIIIKKYYPTLLVDEKFPIDFFFAVLGCQ